MKRLPVAVALCALLATGGASACLCEGEIAGFIHADLKRLPANARGALFQLPPGSGIGLDAAAFTIVSDRHSRPIKAEISWPTLGIHDPHLRSERMLARVGPVGGFQPGARYTITYHGADTGWTHPLRAEFTIDAAALKVGTYQLVLASSPARRMLALEASWGVCSSHQAAIVAEFDYRIPPHYAPYRSAMIYASETRGADGSSRLTAYSPSQCQPWTPGATAMRDGRDLVHANCRQPGPPVTVRGHAGLLEVEDALQTTNDLPVDFRQASGQACSGGGMLDEAVAQADTARIKELVCAVGDEPWYLDDAPRPTLPSITTLIKLARMPDSPPKACLTSASSRWQDEVQYRFRRVFMPLLLAFDLLRREVMRLIPE